MKISASILAAGAILAFAAPTGNAASTVTAGPADNVVRANLVHKSPSQSSVFGDLMRGQHQFLTQVRQPRSAAAATLTAELDYAAEQNVHPSWWQLLIDYRFGRFLG